MGHLETRGCEDIVYPQRRRNKLEGPADPESLLEPCVLPVASDGGVSIGIGDVVKIAGDKGGVGAAVQADPYFLRLIGTVPEGVAELADNGAGSVHDAVIYIPDNLQVAVFLAAEQHGLKVGRKDADGVLTGQDIRSNQAFSCAEAVRAFVYMYKGIQDREPREDDYPGSVQSRPDIVAGEIIIRVVQLGLDIGDIGLGAVTGQRLVEFLKAKDVGLLAADKLEHLGAGSNRRPFLSYKVVEAANVPGQDAKGGARQSLFLEVVARVHGQKMADIGPADNQCCQREQ